MDLQNLAILLGALFFAISGLVHLFRIFSSFEFKIGSFSVPHWGSYIYVIFAAFETYFLFMML